MVEIELRNVERRQYLVQHAENSNRRIFESCLGRKEPLTIMYVLLLRL